MPGPKPLHEQIKEDYKKKMEKAEGNEKIRFLFECAYLGKTSGNIGEYADLESEAVDYFTPMDDEGFLKGGLARRRIAEAAKFMDEEVFLPFQEFREKNPNHSDEWYKEHFTETKAGAYLDMFTDVMTTVSLILSDYKKPYFGDENKDMFGRKREPDESVLTTLLVEENRKRRDRMSPEKVGRLEQAEAILRHGDSARYIKGIQKEVVTSDLTGEFQDWVNTDLETTEAYHDRQKKLKEAEPKYNLDKMADEIQVRHFKEFDYSFLKDDAMKKSLNELHQDAETYDQMNGRVSVENYEKNKALFEKLDDFSNQLKKADHSFWINSGKYNDVKNSLKKLRETLVNGVTPENGKAVRKAYQELSDCCDAYEKKNPGVRKQKTGRQRKQIVFDLRDFVEQQMGKLPAANISRRNSSIGTICSWTDLDKERRQEMQSGSKLEQRMIRSNSAVSRKSQNLEKSGNVL